MLRTIKRLWRDSFLFFCLVLAIGALILVFGVFPHLPTMKLTTGFLLSLPFIIALVFVILAIILALAVSGLIKKKDDLPGGITLFGENGIIRNIPANHAWVLKNNLSLFGFIRSNPGAITPVTVTDPITGVRTTNITETAPLNYTKKSEGWQGYIPGLQTNMGVVNLAQKPRDPEPIPVMTSDGQKVTIDWRLETFVSDPVRFLLRVETDEKRIKFEDERITAILAQICSKKDLAALINLGTDDLKKTGGKALNSFNEGMRSLGIQANALEIQSIIPPQEVIDAAEAQTVAKKRLAAVDSRAEELRKFIDGTKTTTTPKGFWGRLFGRKKEVSANPTMVIIGEMIRSTLADTINPLLNGRKKKEKKEEEE